MLRDRISGLSVPRRGFLAGSAGLLAGAQAFAQVPLAPAAPAAASNQPIIDVPGAQRNPIPIAITGLTGGPGGVDIGGVINADLGRCGLFRPLDQTFAPTYRHA